MLSPASPDILAELRQLDETLHLQAPERKRTLLTGTRRDKWRHTNGKPVPGLGLLEMSGVSPDTPVSDDTAGLVLPGATVAWEGVWRYLPYFASRGRLKVITYDVADLGYNPEAGRFTLPALITNYSYWYSGFGQEPYAGKYTQVLPDFFDHRDITDREAAQARERLSQPLAGEDLQYILAELGRGALGIYRDATPELSA